MPSDNQNYENALRPQNSRNDLPIFNLIPVIISSTIFHDIFYFFILSIFFKFSLLFSLLLLLWKFKLGIENGMSTVTTISKAKDLIKLELNQLNQLTHYSRDDQLNDESKKKKKDLASEPLPKTMMKISTMKTQRFSVEGKQMSSEFESKRATDV